MLQSKQTQIYKYSLAWAQTTSHDLTHMTSHPVEKVVGGSIQLSVKYSFLLFRFTVNRVYNKYLISGLLLRPDQTEEEQTDFSSLCRRCCLHRYVCARRPAVSGWLMWAHPQLTRRFDSWTDSVCLISWSHGSAHSDTLPSSQLIALPPDTGRSSVNLIQRQEGGGLWVIWSQTCWNPRGSSGRLFSF